MGAQRGQSSEQRESEGTEQSKRGSSPSIQRTASETATGPQTEDPATRGQYVQRYGVDIDTPGQVERLQRLEQSNSLATVQRWADEGIPIEAMGTPSKMEAYRQREDTPVPWDVEQRNEQSLQRSTRAAEDTGPAGETQVPESVRDVVSSPGQPVDAALRKPVESEIGQSLEHARVHRSPAADAACEQLNARAFTVKNHVAVRSDQPDPQTPAGQHLMSHELTHVAQQTGGAVSLLPDVGALEVDPDPKLEREAEATAQRVMNGGAVGIQRMSDTGVHIQRSCFGCWPWKSKKRQPRQHASTATQQPAPSVSTAPQQPAPNASTTPQQAPNAPAVAQPRKGLLSKAEFDERGARLRGETRGSDGRIIPGAMEQKGPSCWLAALQASWAALGADTTSLQNIMAAYPGPYSDIGKLTMDHTVDLTTALGSCNIIDDGIKAEILDIVYDGLKSRSNAGLDPAARIYNPAVKGTASAYALLYQISVNQKSGQGIGCNAPAVTAEDLRIARNLLKEVCQKGSSAGVEIFAPVVPLSNMVSLKKTFMYFVEHFGTPLRIGLHTRYTRTGHGAWADTDPAVHSRLSSQSPNTRGPTIEDLKEDHCVLIAGITEDNGETYVIYSDGHHSDQTYDIQTLDEFLTPRFIPAIRNTFKREPDSRDVLWYEKMDMSDQMRDAVTNR